MNEILKELAKPLSEDAIQRTKKEETKKGYDTTGYSYQYIIDRFNEVCGEKWSFEWKLLKEIQGTYKSGAPYFDLTVEVIIVVGDWKGRSCIGGHTAMNYGDALKGAITNGFKKAASFWGPGREAYAGTIDDDNKPLPDSDVNRNGHGSEVDTEIQKQKARQQLDGLPQNIKDGFIILKYTAAEVFSFCNRFGWDNPRIMAEINKIIDMKNKM
jgi:hypothetical protein